MASITISSRKRPWLVFSLLSMLALLVPALAGAVTRNVDQADPACNDASGTPFCKIQPAVSASAAGDVIVIAAGIYIDQITLDRNLTLRGAGISAVAGSCSGQTSILGASPISVLAGVRATVIDVTVRNSINNLGGGVFNEGTLTMLNSEVCNNATFSQGGGIYTSGRLILFNVQVYGNGQVSSGTDGGGLYVATGGVAVVNKSSFTGNRVSRGGGISVAAGATLILRKSTVQSNFADNTFASLLGGWGGGIYNAGVAIIDETQIGGRFSEGNVALDTNGNGGGIYNAGGLLLTKSTIIGNLVEPVTLGGAVLVGAGLYNAGVASLVSTTVSENAFNPNIFGEGAGIYNYLTGTLSLSNVTITANTNSGAGIGLGAGVHNDAGTVTVRNSIIASQTFGNDCAGIVTTDGYNIDSDGTCGLVAVASGGTDQPAVANPGLLPLADYGGPTLTHSLAEDSPAIDAGNPAGCLADLNGVGVANVPLVSDQRGNFFVEVDGVGGNPSGCDAGAVEFNLLTNGMMEDDDEGDRLPDGWTGTNLLGADRLFCQPRLAHEGRCFFRLRGDSNQTKQLVQELVRSGFAGDSYTLRIFTRGLNLTGNPVVRLQFDDLQTIGIDEEFVLPLTVGTYNYQEHTLDITSAIVSVNGYDVVRVILEEGTAGGLGIDDVSLVPRP